jgi:hypothetical protein
MQIVVLFRFSPLANEPRKCMNDVFSQQHWGLDVQPRNNFVSRIVLSTLPATTPVQPMAKEIVNHTQLRQKKMLNITDVAKRSFASPTCLFDEALYLEKLAKFVNKTTTNPNTFCPVKKA